MINHLPNYIPLIFVLTTLITVWFFYKASGSSRTVLFVIPAWLVLQAFIALSGFYLFTDSLPPRFTLLVLIPLLVIILLFMTEKGRTFIDHLEPKYLMMLHVVRIPVEMVLLWLYFNNAVPGLMTFEGRNFDILAGLSAPFVYYFCFVKPKLSRKFILGWNYLCLLLLINIVVNAALSVPFPFQQFAFDQPNIAILYFPFIWLPCCVVPVVLLSHLAVIRQIRTGKFDMKK